MVSTLVMVLVVIAFGTRASDALTVRQQEVILSKLPEADGVAYYHLLRRRVRKVRIMRALALLSVFFVIYAYRHGQLRSRHTPQLRPDASATSPEQQAKTPGADSR